MMMMMMMMMMPNELHGRAYLRCTLPARSFGPNRSLSLSLSLPLHGWLHRETVQTGYFLGLNVTTHHDGDCCQKEKREETETRRRMQPLSRRELWNVWDTLTGFDCDLIPDNISPNRG